MPWACHLGMGSVGVHVPDHIRPVFRSVAAIVDVRARAPALGDVVAPEIGVIRRLALRFPDLSGKPRHAKVQDHGTVRAVAGYGTCELGQLDFRDQSGLSGPAEVDLDGVESPSGKCVAVLLVMVERADSEI